MGKHVASQHHLSTRTVPKNTTPFRATFEL